MPTRPLPFDRSYWAAPGRLLGGAYPGDLEPAEAKLKLAGLVRCGVTLAITLMQDGEVKQSGSPFVDYRPTLEALAREACRVIECRRLPIRDMGVPTAAHMGNILDTIDAASSAGRVVYVHCWGGKGRTSTVIGCYLARHGLTVGEAALDRLNALTKDSPYDFNYVPQTDEQCDFVRNWRQRQ